MVTPLLRIAIYTRQSRDHGDEFSSCDAQFDICHDFISANKTKGWVWCGKRYDDLGQSGERLNRPALTQLLDDLRRGRINGVVIHRLDRLSRKLADTTALLTEFRNRNVTLAIVTDPMLGTSATDMLVLNILGSFSEFEREMIRERLADTRAAMKRKGLRVAGKVPYGYTTDRRTKQLVVIRQQARRVQAFFEWATAGQTPSAIAATANARRWPTNPSPTYPQGGRWTPRQVADILANPTYRGLIRTANGTAPGTHEAIISGELFQRVREVIVNRRVSTTPRGSPAFEWPLRGVVECGRCGRMMSTSVIHHRQLRYCHYRCRSHAGGRPPCKGVAVPAHEIEQLVLRELRELNPERFRSQARRQEATDFCSLWDTLTDQERVDNLRVVVERVRFDPNRGKIQLNLRGGVVGAAAGIIANRQPPPEPVPNTRKRQRQPNATHSPSEAIYLPHQSSETC
ncbi:MAG: recombinase family protein [Planctomycetes bacterium]|nr:recombinase family protein [Planctomycetota bacterium]